MAQPAFQQLGHSAENQPQSSVIDLRTKSTEAPLLQAFRHKTPSGEKSLELIFAVEAGIREAENLQALKYFAVNELQHLIPASQVMIFKRKSAGRKWVVETVSSLAAPDDRSPVLQWLCKELRVKEEALASHVPVTVRLDMTNAPDHAAPFQYALFTYLRFDIGGGDIVIAFFSDKPFSGSHKNILARLSGTFGHAWSVFDRGSIVSALRVPRPIKWIVAMGLLLLMFVPVPLTVLAPAQITSYQPKIISAPISGIIKEIYVLPNQEVKEGDILYSFDKTEAQNSLDQSSRGLLVAQSRFRRANQAAFGAGALKGEMAIAKAEADLALSEQASYQRRLVMADVHAVSSGIILFESVEKWIGRPVETGERVMKIADPRALSIKIDLATDDAILLSTNARAKIFLDANPLEPFEAKITRTSYDAVKSEHDILVFTIHAKLVKTDDQQFQDLRIGLRGTAQLFGDKVPVWFFLFRKPLSYLRQITGL